MAFSDEDVLDAMRIGKTTITEITCYLTGIEDHRKLDDKGHKEFMSRKQQVAHRVYSLHRHKMVESDKMNNRCVVTWKIKE